MTSKVAIGFIMDQVAGHVTGYRNLRRVADADPEIEPFWCEIHYEIERGAIERVHQRWFSRLSDHPFGAVRGYLEQGRALRSGNFDVLYTNTTVAYLDQGPVRRTPTLFDFDSTPLQREQMGGYSKYRTVGAISAAKHRAMRRFYRRASVNQAWSNWARQSVIDDYDIDETRVVVNPPGVDLGFWTPDRRQPRDTERPARVLFVGGDFERKGGFDLLEWHRSLAPGIAELDIVTRDDVPAQPGVRVHHGVGPNSDELLALHAVADVFVLPSTSECFGIATIEAMASGIPVVTSDVGGTADIVDPGRTGYIVPAGSARRLGEAIEAIIGRDDRGTALGVAARERAEQRFDLTANAQATLDRLKSLARQPR